MLNLMGIELRKLVRSKTFWFCIIFYVVVILSTFIPVSYTDGAITVPTGKDLGLEETMAEVDEILAEVNEILANAYGQQSLHGNFIQGFYSTSSGMFAVIVIVVSLMIVWDFIGGTMGNILISGHSRRQIYLVKLVCGLVYGAMMLAVSMAMVAALGVFFYDTPITTQSLNTMGTIFVAQLVTMISYVSVGTAAAFIIGNAWAVLADVLFFAAVTPLPLYVNLIRGKGSSLLYSVTPSIVIITGVESYHSLDAMLCTPSSWTPGFVALALVINLAIVVAATALGMLVFQKRDI